VSEIILDRSQVRRSIDGIVAASNEIATLTPVPLSWQIASQLKNLAIEQNFY